MTEFSPTQESVPAIVRRGFLGRALFHNAHEALDGQYVIDFDHPAEVISPRYNSEVIKALYDSDVRHLGLRYTLASERLLGVPMDDIDRSLVLPDQLVVDLRVRTYGFRGPGTALYPQDEIPMLDIRYDRHDEDQLRIAITHQHVGEE